VTALAVVGWHISDPRAAAAPADFKIPAKIEGRSNAGTRIRQAIDLNPTFARGYRASPPLTFCRLPSFRHAQRGLRRKWPSSWPAGLGGLMRLARNVSELVECRMD
jgi:hypothetical protein